MSVASTRKRSRCLGNGRRPLAEAPPPNRGIEVPPPPAEREDESRFSQLS